MVVLEEGSMLTTGHNQYLQPDYLSPLSTPVSTVFLYYFPVQIFTHAKINIGIIKILKSQFSLMRFSHEISPFYVRRHQKERIIVAHLLPFINACLIFASV